MVVEDWFAEVEDGGFGNDAVRGVVVGSVDVFGAVRGIDSRTHICEKMDRCR